MQQTLIFDEDLIRRYDRSGPRYTSYPTAVQFHEGFGEARYRELAAASNEARPPRPLSLYFHIPFCDTVCYYCACNKVVTKDRGLAAPYLARLHREIALQGALFDEARTVDQLHWGGGTPTFISPAQMRELMAVTRRHFRLRDDDTGEYSIEVDPREADAGTIALLREIGFNRLSLGVQDFDERVQRAVNRIQPEAQTVAVLEAARREGFRSVSVDLIYGLPFQSVESWGRTLDRILALAPDRLSVFNYAHLPELFKPQRRIHAEDLPSPAEKLAILALTIERLTQAGYVYIGMDHFARPDDELAVAQREGTLYRNFQGYSTHAHCDLVGLGATSISMVGPSYAQNRRDLEGYYAAIDAGRLAVFRGVELDADDRLRRDVIMRLICHFRLAFADIETAHGIRFTEYFAPELEEIRAMEADGLLHLGDDGIEVAPRGRLLIRNICMVFDRYLRESRGQRFSKVI
ncbi:oxygen-independent coproporphyrinogen III oxidase [Inmirania thermothiophila]|uniref:Coproporphyrinogen-III oxidase n=1 Tax=Inmirania thermothiophila TaxID=1750597 RepID=A0A3N1Y9J5_9GAMM|nr:oxygen-independent coproporphyrinogen III oxidase [Inmirania thermothiophila]ROR35158.1 oxygen-independent coproporphyrinogen-3 oxidase [Inmirania thermothiophila]